MRALAGSKQVVVVLQSLWSDTAVISLQVVSSDAGGGFSCVLDYISSPIASFET